MPSLGPTSNQPTTNSQQRTATRVAGVGVNGKQSGNNGSKDTKVLGCVSVWKTGKNDAEKYFDKKLPNRKVHWLYFKIKGLAIKKLHKIFPSRNNQKG